MTDSSFMEGFMTGQNSGGGNSNGGYGGMGAWGAESWWFIIVLFALWGGFGGNGWGNNGGGAGTQGALTRGDLCNEFSFNDLQNGVRNISDSVNLGFANLNSTICHQQYDTAMQTNAIQAAVNGGFQNLNSTICNAAYENAGLINGLSNTVQSGFNAMNISNLQTANAQNIANLQSTNAIQNAISDCCCKEQTSFMQIGNQIERSICDTNYNAATNTTAIIQNAHNDTDRVIARLDAMEMARKDETIANLRTQLAACGDQSTAQYIINQLTNVISPRAVPAYPASSPCGLGNWAPQVLASNYGFGYNNCGCCGCGA